MPITETEWKCLQPEKLAIDPDATSAEDEWKFWYKTFSNFVAAMPQDDGAIDKLSVLTAHLTAPIYKLVSEETTYDGAINALKNLFVKPKNEIYAPHTLASVQQNVSEPIDEFVFCINKFSRECDFAGVNAQQYRDDMKRDSFINGISSNFIRQIPLEGTDAGPGEVEDQAVNSVRQSKSNQSFVCYFCGGRKWHPRSRCPAKNKTCNFCKKVGHFAKCCLSKKKSANCIQPSLATTTALP